MKKTLERRITALEQTTADAAQLGTIAQWRMWNAGEDVPADVHSRFAERRAVAMANVLATFADFEDTE